MDQRQKNIIRMRYNVSIDTKRMEESIRIAKEAMIDLYYLIVRIKTKNLRQGTRFE